MCTIYVYGYIPEDVVLDILLEGGATKVEKLNDVAYKIEYYYGELSAIKEGILYEFKKRGYNFTYTNIIREDY